MRQARKPLKSGIVKEVEEALRREAVGGTANAAANAPVWKRTTAPSGPRTLGQPQHATSGPVTALQSSVHDPLPSQGLHVR